MAKRFWHQATASQQGDTWSILLDSKPLRLPSGAPIAVRGACLAAAIAAEWQAAGGGHQGGNFTQTDMPLTGLAGTAQDRIAPHRDAMIDTLAGYAACDLLCYRTETPRTLAERQHAIWQPWLDWAATHHAAPLTVTTGITHIPQPRGSLAALRAALAAHDNEMLAGLGLAVPALGSCVLGLAIAERAIDPAAAAAAASLDTLFQEERWGKDEEGAAMRDRLHHDIALAARFMALHQDRPYHGQ